MIALLSALLACAAFAQTAPGLKVSPELKISVYDPAGAATPLDVAQLSQSAFHDVPPGPVKLHGDAKEVHWLRVEVDLPPLADDDTRWVLWFERAHVDRLAVHSLDGSVSATTSPVDFFVPDKKHDAHAGGYGFTLPRALSGPTTLYVEAIGQGHFSLSPRIRTESEMAAHDRNAVMVFTAVYTGLTLLLLIGLGMYIALRDRLYLQYLFYVGALLVFLLADNGHLYELPWIGKWGYWHTLGLYALANVLAAATVVLARGFAGLPRSETGLDRLLRLFPAIPFTFVLVCLFNRAWTVGLIQVMTTTFALGAILLAAVATAMAWRHKRHLAFPMLLMWLLLFVAGCVRALDTYGAVASNDWTQYGYQVVAALTALMLGFALSDRIIEFRLQRDRARLAKDQVDASLRLERERRKFVESLNELRTASVGDQEWLAFRRLLEALRQIVPQHSSAVVLNAFHDSDLLLCEPNEARDDYQSLLSTRGGALKGIWRSQLPMQLRIDSPASTDGVQQDLAQFAVLPLPLSAPAWGVLLIERRGWQTFERDELVLANEFVQKATQAVEAAANDRALRRSAEFDALTGAYNRRTVNTRLETYFKNSLARNTPLAVLLVDLDHLKELNDKHGYAAGDSSLRVLAETLSRHCAKKGEYGRYGGDEFVVMLPDMSPEQARSWAEAMRIDATSHDLAFPSGKLRLSVSVGIASRRPEDGTAQELVEHVNKALYEAKRMGRNRVQVAAAYSAVRASGKQ
ncbi:MAG TPA: diguanylate cyclase [Xanthomonadaceae bacterium]|nr:diguanylate cyclase [Xanthomonadaceae bacterium]